MAWQLCDFPWDPAPLRPDGLSCCPFQGGGSVVDDPLFGMLPIGCGGSVFIFGLFCITLRPF